MSDRARPSLLDVEFLCGSFDLRRCSLAMSGLGELRG
jgi:hypothetical protein